MTLILIVDNAETDNFFAMRSTNPSIHFRVTCRRDFRVQISAYVVVLHDVLELRVVDSAGLFNSETWWPPGQRELFSILLVGNVCSSVVQRRTEADAPHRASHDKSPILFAIFHGSASHLAKRQWPASRDLWSSRWNSPRMHVRCSCACRIK